MELELYLDDYDDYATIELTYYYYQSPTTTSRWAAETPEDLYGDEDFDYIVYVNGVNVTNQISEKDNEYIQEQIKAGAEEARSNPDLDY